jgi:hypothetical protein
MRQYKFLYIIPYISIYIYILYTYIYIYIYIQTHIHRYYETMKKNNLTSIWTKLKVSHMCNVEEKNLTQKLCRFTTSSVQRSKQFFDDRNQNSGYQGLLTGWDMNEIFGVLLI